MIDALEFLTDARLRKLVARNYKTLAPHYKRAAGVISDVYPWNGTARLRVQCPTCHTIDNHGHDLNETTWTLLPAPHELTLAEVKQAIADGAEVVVTCSKCREILAETDLNCQFVCVFPPYAMPVCTINVSPTVSEVAPAPPQRPGASS